MDNDVAIVIDRTDLIENIIDQIITKYVSPRKEIYTFFRIVVLNHSIISLGGKVKLVKLIAKDIGSELDVQPIYMVLRYRNAFAHHRLQSHPTIMVGKNPDEDKSEYQLVVMTNSKVVRESRETALKKFNENYILAKDKLIRLRNELVSYLDSESYKH
jgi:hypothetical protein